MAIYLGSNKVRLQGIIANEEEVVTDAVRFIDYDGTIFHEYSKEEFLALSSMPANPSHTGLISQGWNWSLSDAKDFVNEKGYLNIGQMYTTISGDTEIDIYFPPDCARLSPYLGIAINGEVDIDWGDNSTHSTVTGTSLTTQIRTQHIYSQPGNYTIKIHVNSGSFALYGNSTTYPILNANNSSSNYNRVYSNIVKNIRIGENCAIGNYAFYNCHSLQSVTIPSSVTSIASYAFISCYSLKSITIPNTVTSIGDSAFQYCYFLSSITIPNSVTSIGITPFYFCCSLSSITIPANCVVSFSSDYFYRCYSLNIRILPGSVVIKNNYHKTIPSSVTSIASSAFSNCYPLSSVTIPSSVTSIGSYAFNKCYSLKPITIPNTVTSIGDSAFAYCYPLSSVTIPNSVTSIGSSVFYNCFSLQSITIPNTVTSIGSNAFYYCYSISSVTIPNSVTSIGNSAFSSCYSISSVTIPNSVTSIGNSAFSSCYSLSSVTIPSSVTSIGNSAFYNCYGMKEYHLKPITPPTLGSSSFSNIPSDCIIYVPQGSLSSYQSETNWSAYADYMQEETN